MKCTRIWVTRQLGLVLLELVITAPTIVALFLTSAMARVQTIPWAEALLTVGIVVTYVVSTLCVGALAVQETVRWFVGMVEGMKNE